MSIKSLLQNPHKELERALGYRFRRRARLDLALTHPSFRHEALDTAEDNQRLEFLGDAVLGMVVADYLVATHHDHHEGDLTRLRSQIASTQPLARIAKSIGVGTSLRLGRGEAQNGGMQREGNLADALEAILGAAYLDGGLKAVQKIFKNLFVPLLEQSETGDNENPKGALQELCQKLWKINPEYRVTSEEGPAHARTYTIEAVVRGVVYSTGTGPSKRAAESAAARAALQHLRTE
ncbi:MAG: ribonuclease III [Verrucomicrobia bacterium]|nr:MAG: ribonuclease III [Verrucomicrobiota bacterium]